jgi:hypothetical protein
LGAPDDVTREKLDAHLRDGVGHICGVGTSAGDAVGIAKLNNELQRYLKDHTRLGRVSEVVSGG